VTHRASTGGRLFWLGFALSAAVHLTFGFYLFTRYEHAPGAVDVPTDAISVNLETTDILNAPEESPAVQAAGANPPGETGEVTPPDKVESAPEEPRQPPPQDEPVKAENPPEEPAKPDPAETEKQEAERVEQQRLAEETLRRAMDAEREKREAQQREREAQQRAEEEERQRQREAAEREEERERQAEAREKAEKQRRERKAAKANGGATGSQGARASSGRVSASQGDIRNYGASVRAKIARNSPGSKGAKGDARIAVSISPSGGLISARIVTSSGNAELDRSALAAVRRSSPFPPPPKGATRDQLSFTIPFQFH
jgi:TolA protein